MNLGRNRLYNPNLNSKALAMRDPAKAAFMGVDFGGQPHFGSERSRVGRSFMGLDIASAGPTAMVSAASMDAVAQANQIPAATVHQIVQQHIASTQNTSRRYSVLHPNNGSDIAVQHYGVALSQALTLGTAVGLSAQQTPQTTIRPQRVTANAPEPGFCYLSAILAGNLSGLVGGQFDAFDFNANAVDAALDLQTIMAGVPIAMVGTYTGDSAGRTPASSYLFTLSIRGPAQQTT